MRIRFFTVRCPYCNRLNEQRKLLSYNSYNLRCNRIKNLIQEEKPSETYRCRKCKKRIPKE